MLLRLVVNLVNEIYKESYDEDICICILFMFVLKTTYSKCKDEISLLYLYQVKWYIQYYRSVILHRQSKSNTFNKISVSSTWIPYNLLSRHRCVDHHIDEGLYSIGKQLLTQVEFTE